MPDSHAISLSWSHPVALCEVASQRFLAGILWRMLLLKHRAAIAVEVQEGLDGCSQPLFDLQEERTWESGHGQCAIVM